jgi:hypothetical protein
MVEGSVSIMKKGGSSSVRGGEGDAGRARLMGVRSSALLERDLLRSRWEVRIPSSFTRT